MKLHHLNLKLVSLVCAGLIVTTFVGARSDKKLLCEIKKLLDREICQEPIIIDHVPFTITRSGKHCVKKELVFNGPGAAITVAANNVTINFNDFNLTLNDFGSIGILATDVSELVIENDSIRTPLVSTNINNAAVKLTRTNKVTLNNIFTENTYFGVLIEDSTDVFIRRSRFKDHIGGANDFTTASGGIKAVHSSAVVVEESTFSGTNPDQGGNFRSTHLMFLNGCTNGRVSNCQFVDTDLSVLAARIDGLIVENCTFNASPFATFNLIELGRFDADQTHDVIIRNCTLRQTNNVIGFQALLCAQGSGALVEDCIIDVATAFLAGDAGTGIILGFDLGDGAFVSFEDITLRHCIIKGACTFGISLFASLHGAVIDNCQIATTGQFANVFVNRATDAVIKNSEISQAVGTEPGTGMGIHLTSFAQGCALLNNAVKNNENTGIQIDAGATNNHLQDNKVFNNGGFGISNNGTGTEIYNNTSCNNAAGNDCGGVSESGPLGSPVTLGKNLCCSTVPKQVVLKR